MNICDIAKGAWSKRCLPPLLWFLFTNADVCKKEAHQEQIMFANTS